LRCFKTKDSDKKKETNVVHDNSNLFETTANALDTLLSDILKRDMHIVGFLNIYKHCEPWITSINDHERERVSKSLLNLLEFYATNLKDVDQTMPNIGFLGNILGRLIPRTTDSIIQVRINSIKSIESLLNILSMCTKHEPDQLEDERANLKHLQSIGEKLHQNDSNLLLLSINELSKV
jgi:hypothetical protein